MFSSVLRTVARPAAATITRSVAPAMVRADWTKASAAAVLPTIQRRLKSDLTGMNSKVCAVLGGQWGDEGKGKLVDILAARYDMVARFNGGANAGHTLVVNGKKFAFHLLPCGMLYDGKVNLIGNGVVLDVEKLFDELANLDKAGVNYAGRLKISDRAHLLFRFHKIIDGQQESALGAQNIGTTKKGIGPCYSSKTTRNGIRAGDLLEWDSFVEKLPKLAATLSKQYGFEYDKDLKAELDIFNQRKAQLQSMIIDTVHYVNSALKSGKSVLAEGANAALLDLDFGTYPFVTSSPTSAGGISTGLGIPPNKIECIIGVVKAYTTRVGAGPFPTELLDTVGEEMRKVGGEFGTTTGRPRRCGWLDIPVVRYSHMINGYNSINITKLDVLSGLKEIKIGTHYRVAGKRLPDGLMPSSLAELGKCEVEYETLPGWNSDISKARSWKDLPKNAQNYLTRIEDLVGIPISWVGVGPGRDAMIDITGKK